MIHLPHLPVYTDFPTGSPNENWLFLHPKFIFQAVRSGWHRTLLSILANFSSNWFSPNSHVYHYWLIPVRTGLQRTNSLDPIGWKFWYTFTVMPNITRIRSGVQVGNVWAVGQAATGLENIVQSLQSHMILSMSHWSSGLTCLLPITRVTGSNPLGDIYVKPGFSC